MSLTFVEKLLSFCPNTDPIDSGLIAGSCATTIHEPRQIRKEATVMTLFVCHRVLGYHFFVKSLSASVRDHSRDRKTP